MNDDHLSKGIKCTLYEVVVESTLLYASETWALPRQQLHSLEVFSIELSQEKLQSQLKNKINNDLILG